MTQNTSDLNTVPNCADPEGGRCAGHPWARACAGAALVWATALAPVAAASLLAAYGLDALGVVVTSVAQTQRLADAIEHMGDKFATEIKRLGEVWTIDRDHTREQLEEIKGRLNRRAER